MTPWSSGRGRFSTDLASECVALAEALVVVETVPVTLPSALITA
jgi:hypothetical protein